MTSTVIYEGQLRSRCTHLASASRIDTDAPKDNQGKGEAFSPTDLVATALGSCMLTIMGIKARDLGIELEGTEAQVTKKMGDSPRRIIAIDILLKFPHNWDAKTKTLLERAAASCPVHHSLHPDIAKNIDFIWP